MATTQRDKYTQTGRLGGAPFMPIHRDEAEQIRLTGGGSASLVGGGSGVGSSGVDNKGRSENLAKPRVPKAPEDTGGGSGGGYNPYAAQANALYQQLMNRGPFRYDLQGDMLYRQYADQYSQLGQQAMRDTMGAASALTGGYGNSYANLVGNQAYQGYLGQLNAMVPEFYDRAYQVWRDEGDDLMARYELARSRAAMNAAPLRTPIEETEEEEETVTTTEAPKMRVEPLMVPVDQPIQVYTMQTPTFTTPTLTPEFTLDLQQQWYDYLKGLNK